MGVSYYSCSCCNEALYSEYVAGCESCCENLCKDCLVDTEGLTGEGRYMHPFSNEDGEVESKYCPYCQGHEIDEDEFISFLVKKLGKSRDELENEFKRKR